MRAALTLLAVVATALGCANVVDDAGTAPPANNNRAPWGGPRDGAQAGGSDVQPADPGAQPGDSGATDPTDPSAPADVVHDSAPGTPADAHDACVVASDCAPATANELPGFSCASDVCTCDDANATSCGADGGTWSSFECACFVNTETAMPQALPETPGEADAGTTCWWRYRDTGCDDATWVDTSYYEYSCDAPDDCYDHYVERGYSEPGACHGRWIKRCDDGNEYWS